MLRSLGFLLREGITKPYQARIRHLSELSSGARICWEEITYLFLPSRSFVTCWSLLSFIRITAVPTKTPQLFLSWRVGLRPKGRGAPGRKKEKKGRRKIFHSLSFLSLSLEPPLL